MKSPPGGFAPLLAREAIQWLRASEKHPFFLYLAFTSPHVPLQEPERWMNLYRESAPDVGHQLYWAAISHLDHAVGQLMAEVDRLGQRNNTLVIFLSDKGAPESALRQGDWKLIQRKAGPELSHLAGDEGETKNQAAENPRIGQRLRNVLEAETVNDNDARPRSNP